jgi:hypothetical protein
MRHPRTIALLWGADSEGVSSDPRQREVLNAQLDILRVRGPIGSEISLHNKHGYARGEHCHCGERHEGPSQAGTRLALHQLLVRSDDQDCDEKEGCQQPGAVFARWRGLRILSLAPLER